VTSTPRPRSPRASLAAVAGARAPVSIWLGGAAVALVTFAAFIPALSNGFVNWDDAENFLRNPHYRGLAWENLRWMFTTAHTGHYIPITWITLAIDYLVWGMDPRGYHLTAIALHSLNALLVYVLAIRLLGRVFEDGPATTLALAAGTAALLFSVHPLRVESVAWATERRDLVAGAFTLLTVLCYLTAHRRGVSGRLHAGWHWASVALFAFALLSKSIVVGLPLVLLALDFYPLRRVTGSGTAGRVPIRQLLLEKAPYVALSAAMCALMLAIGFRQELITTLGSLTLAQRIAISSFSLMFYLWKTLAPWPLSPLYPLRYPIALAAPKYLAASLLVVAFTAGVVVMRRRWPAGLALWTCYGILLLPVLGIIHNGTQIAADRYTYLACLGWALLGGAGVAWSLRAARIGAAPAGLGRMVVLLAATCVISLAALTVLEIRVWRDSESLWQHAVDQDPGNPFAHYHLAGALDRLGRVGEAKAEYERALALAPAELPSARSMFHASLGILLQREGDQKGAEESYLSAIRHSENALALNNLGVIAGMRGDNAAALDYFRRAVRVEPGHSSACENLRALSARLGASLQDASGCPKNASSVH
jgi:protein O-mannosyl-transferase